MPRIRSWQDLHLFRPDADARFEHIDGLFTGTIDWPLIEAHLPDMLRVVLSIRAGRLLPSACEDLARIVAVVHRVLLCHLLRPTHEHR